MKIIEQSFKIEGLLNGTEIIKAIEAAGRTCYKSEEAITRDSAKAFVAKIIKSGHHSVLEHQSLSVRMVTNRGVSHEIVRHRIASYSQESTRYCNYSKDKFGNEITVILPVWFKEEWREYSEPGAVTDSPRWLEFLTWLNCNTAIEKAYFKSLVQGSAPQEARDLLPNALKTEIVMTANMREWRHFFTLRAAPAAHPQMRELATDMLAHFKERIPVIFDNINP